MPSELVTSAPRRGGFGLFMRFLGSLARYLAAFLARLDRA